MITNLKNIKIEPKMYYFDKESGEFNECDSDESHSRLYIGSIIKTTDLVKFGLVQYSAKAETIWSYGVIMNEEVLAVTDDIDLGILIMFRFMGEWMLLGRMANGNSLCMKINRAFRKFMKQCVRSL